MIYLIVNMTGLTGYGRFESDFIPPGSELSVGNKNQSMISLLLLSPQRKLSWFSAAKTR